MAAVHCSLWPLGGSHAMGHCLPAHYPLTALSLSAGSGMEHPHHVPLSLQVMTAQHGAALPLLGVEVMV